MGIGCNCNQVRKSKELVTDKKSNNNNTKDTTGKNNSSINQNDSFIDKKSKPGNQNEENKNLKKNVMLVNEVENSDEGKVKEESGIINNQNNNNEIIQNSSTQSLIIMTDVTQSVKIIKSNNSNINNNNDDNKSSVSKSGSEKSEKKLQFIYKDTLAKDAGCGQNSVFTFYLFKSDDNTILVYTSKKKLNGKEKIYIYLKNLDNDNIKEEEIKNEEINNDEIIKDEISNKSIDSNRFIPTQCRYFKIESKEYIVVSFRDGTIYIYQYTNFCIKKINNFSIKDERNEKQPINGVCLFKYNNEIFLISSIQDNSIIDIKYFRDNKDFGCIEAYKKIFFLDIFENRAEIYIICGLSDRVVAYIFKKKNSENQTYIYNKYKNNKSLNTKGHRCAVIYKNKLIDSDTEGKIINIFDFHNGNLLLYTELDYKPLGINVWDNDYIIISNLDKIKSSMDILKIDWPVDNLPKCNDVDLLRKNEERIKKIGTIDYQEQDQSKKGVLYSVKMNNKKYGDFLVSIGYDRCIQLFILDTNI